MNSVEIDDQITAEEEFPHIVSTMVFVIAMAIAIAPYQADITWPKPVGAA